MEEQEKCGQLTEENRSAAVVDEEAEKKVEAVSETGEEAVSGGAGDSVSEGADHDASHGQKDSLQRVRRRRVLTALFVVVLMCFSLAFHSGIGTPSSFGLGTFNLICPMGGLEALLASKTLIPRTVISLVVVLAVCLLVGRAWCAWACPVPLAKKVFGAKEKKADHSACKRSLWETFKSDSRLWVLAGVLIATLVVGLPLFCLVCPVGLTFGTIMSVWRLIQFNDVNLGLLVFPAALVIEVVFYKKWCIRICPIAGLLSLVGRFAKPLRPQVNEATCLHRADGGCKACLEACPAAIDLHAEDAAAQLADCSRCAECKAICPTESIVMPFLPKKRADGEGVVSQPYPAAGDQTKENT